MGLVDFQVKAFKTIKGALCKILQNPFKTLRLLELPKGELSSYRDLFYFRLKQVLTHTSGCSVKFHA